MKPGPKLKRRPDKPEKASGPTTIDTVLKEIYSKTNLLENYMYFWIKIYQSKIYCDKKIKKLKKSEFPISKLILDVNWI